MLESTSDPAANSAPPFRPGEPWPDAHGTPINAHGGGILRHEGRYYWFGEHKIGGDEGNYAHVGVRAYSSATLAHWQDEGVALAVSADPASPIARGCVLERPKVLFNARTGRFVMWFHLDSPDYRLAQCGVATAERPGGPYRFVRAFRPNAGHRPANGSASGEEEFCRRDLAGGQMSRDMTLFLDDDGAAYHLCASEENSTLHVSRLTDDFLDTTGEYVRAFPGRFHEAPAIFKHRGQYFLFSSGCTGWQPNPARLSVAAHPFGPWTELGNPCRGTPEEQATTFRSQSTFVLPVAGREGAYIFMADRWCPANAVDGRYVWLPVGFERGVPFLEWKTAWRLEDFDAGSAR